MRDARGHGVESRRRQSVRKRTFRTVESEVSSNRLPVLLEFVDTVPALERFIPVCQKRMGKKGILVVERGMCGRLETVEEEMR